MDMLTGVISSRTKVQILVKLFLNPGVRAYLRSLANEFNVSPNAVRTELGILSRHKVLVSERDGRNVLYRADTSHPLSPNSPPWCGRSPGSTNWSGPWSTA